MTPHQDAAESLRLSLQKIERAKRAVQSRNHGTALMELDYAAIDIRDARSLLTDEPKEATDGR